MFPYDVVAEPRRPHAKFTHDQNQSEILWIAVSVDKDPGAWMSQDLGEHRETQTKDIHCL
jgi:hypothetical protein